jgi:hypothetical protein
MTAEASTTDPAAYARSLIGTPAVDHGNGTGTQCVDLAKFYSQHISGKVNRTVGLGNGNTVAQGIGNFHGWNYSTDRNDIKPGDIVSFHGTASNGWNRTYGHVVIVYELSGNTARYIHQWQNSRTIHTGSFTLGRNDIVGRVRPPASASNPAPVLRNPHPVPTRLIRLQSPMMQGNDVRFIQWYLVNKFGYSLQIDGWYGPLTETAVRNFQRSQGITVDGIVGPVTIGRLRN